MTVKVRGHHLLCMLTYEGLGYTEGFVRNFDSILKRIRSSEDIEIVEGPDDICHPLLEDKSVHDMHCHLRRVGRRDKLALEAIGNFLERPVTAGSRVRLTEETLARLRKGFQEGIIRSACFNCPWAPKCTDVANAGFEGVTLEIDNSIRSGEGDQR